MEARSSGLSFETMKEMNVGQIGDFEKDFHNLPGQKIGDLDYDSEKNTLAKIKHQPGHFAEELVEKLKDQ